MRQGEVSPLLLPHVIPAKAGISMCHPLPLLAGTPRNAPLDRILSCQGTLNNPTPRKFQGVVTKFATTGKLRPSELHPE